MESLCGLHVNRSLHGEKTHVTTANSFATAKSCHIIYLAVSVTPDESKDVEY